MPIYADIYAGPPRSYSGRADKRWIVVHSTQNSASAQAEAGYAKRRTDGVSSHYYVDGDSLVQSLDTDLSAHHVGSGVGNSGGISYEFCGFAAWSRSRWLASIAWPAVAAAMARDCAAHGIPVRLLSVADVRAGRGGIITHDQARRAWGGTTHTDPGPGFPMDHLVKIVSEGDDVSAEDVWRHRWEKIHLPGETTSAEGAVRWIHKHVSDTRDDLAEIRATLDVLAGRDVTDAVRAELGRHRAELLAELTEDLPDALADRLSEVPAEQVRQAVAEVLRERDRRAAGDDVSDT